MKKFLGLLAVAGVMAVAAPVQRAEALSLISPSVAGSTKHASESLVTEVRHGGGGFRGGGFRGGGFRGFHGGGFRGGFYRGGFYRPHFHRRFYGGPAFYYGGPVYAGPRFCRWIRTYYGPRRVCRYRPWAYYY